MITYKTAGVDKEEGYKSVGLIKEMVKQTYSKNVLTELGSFGALYELGKYDNPVLVSGTDGVGTKLKIAFELGRYTTIGIDCVAMCVNDILCHGATPLFFLDYLACGKLDATIAAQIVSGVTAGCLQAGCALVGGETAEMPGFYAAGDYDIAGFAVGVVEKAAVISGEQIRAGDLIIALASSGVHSNGFSLVRRLISDLSAPFAGQLIGDVLLTPTKIYVKAVLAVLAKYKVNGMAHITGGGLYENIPRIIPEGLCATIDTTKITPVPIFGLVAELGVGREEMFGTFNMGVGFILVVNPSVVAGVLQVLSEHGEVGQVIGTITVDSCKLCLN